jgi:hypothetical protein
LRITVVDSNTSSSDTSNTTTYENTCDISPSVSDYWSEQSYTTNQSSGSGSQCSVRKCDVCNLNSSCIAGSLLECPDALFDELSCSSPVYNNNRYSYNSYSYNTTTCISSAATSISSLSMWHTLDAHSKCCKAVEIDCRGRCKGGLIMTVYCMHVYSATQMFFE